MKSKKVLLVVMCAVVVLAMGAVSVACAKKAPAEKKPEPAPATETTPAGTDAPENVSTEPPEPVATEEPTDSGILNPVVESSSDEIKSMLGIEFAAPDEYADSAKYSIIEDTIAQVEYTMDSGKGPITVTYRAAKSDSDDSLDISGDYNKYDNVEKAKLDGGQEITNNTMDGTGPGLCHWYNKNTVSGGISASVMMDPIMQAEQLTEVATIFVSQESKGF
jgi:hypothetical protein